jgi:hypothetical protein
MKNDKDNCLLHLCRQDTGGKRARREEITPLLVVCHLLIIDGGLLIIPVIIRDMSKTNAKSGQLSSSQQGIRVGDGWVDRDVRELKEWLIPLTVNDLLVVPNNLQALLHDIHVLIHAPACFKDTPEHLQDDGVETRSGGGTTAMGSAGMSGSRSRRTSTRSPWILGHYGAKRLMSYNLIELLLGHHLNHVLNIRCKSTRSQWVGGDVPNLIHNILKNIKAHRPRESIKQVSLIGQNSL